MTTSTHPEPGALRAALDGERPDLRAHLDTCPACLSRQAALAADAAVAADAFADAPPAFDTDSALRAVRGHRAEVVPLPSHAPAPRPRQRLARAAAFLAPVLALGLAIGTPGGRAVAASVLDQFRGEQIAVVPLDVRTVEPEDLEALAELAEAAEVEIEAVVQPQEVADLDAAAAVAGFQAAPLVLDGTDLVGTPVTVMAQAPQTVRIDFAGREGVPDTLRQSVLVVDVPGAVVQRTGGTGDSPGVLRGEAGTLGVRVEGGLTLAEVRDALLELPGLSPDMVEALRGIEEWETTLPLPIPSNRITWEETEVDGIPALAFGDESGLGSALLWREGDRWVGLGGTLPASDLRRLAEGG